MGYRQDESQELAARWRHEFPVTENLIYLNHAAVAPLCRRASDAMKWLAEDGCVNGSLHYSQWEESYAGLRQAAARLINAEPGEIAIVKNTSEGIATVALGLDWKPGDRIVAFHEEFPANYYIWKKLEQWKGVEVQWLSCFDPIERIAEAARGAKLLAISYVQYLSGHKVDLEAIGQVCRRERVFFFVDAIQGMGAFPIDVKRMNIQALAADGHKWMLGPEGNGVLYIEQEWQDRVEPIEFGWTTVAGYVDYASRDMALRRDAGRYECGTLNTIGCFGLRAGIELLLEVGVEAVGRQVTFLADRLAAGACAKGYETMVARTAETAAGIVSIRKQGVDSRMVWSRLREKGITSAPRQGYVRLSPHFYLSPDDIDRVIAELP